MVLTIPDIIAHRGYSSRQKGNTMNAFKDAINSNAVGIELDIWRTNDNHLVINHDNTTGNGESIKHSNYKDLLTSNNDLLELSELMEYLYTSKKSCKVCIEVKGPFDIETVRLIKKFLSKEFESLSINNISVYLMSFSRKYVNALSNFVDQDRLVYLSMDDLDDFSNSKFTIVCLEAGLLSEEVIKSIKDAQKKLWVYGAYNKYNLLTSIKSGACCVIVNDIEFTEKIFMTQPSSY